MCKPGVYVFWNGEERLYIGCSSDLAKRPKKRDRGHASRFAAILAADRVELIACDTLDAAKQLEEQLIRQYRPIYNKRTPRGPANLERAWQIARTLSDLVSPSIPTA